MVICEEIYLFSKEFPKEELYWLTNQIRRAWVSICSNIAEWNAKSSNKHFVVYLENALGSAFEVQTQYLIAIRLNYWKNDLYQWLEEKIIEVIQLLSWLIRKYKYQNT